MPSQEEINLHLEELNRTTLVETRMKRLKWFYEHKIKVVEIETTFYLVPKNIDPKEFVKRFVEVNIQLRFLNLRLNWFRAMGLGLRIEEVLGVQKYKYLGEKKDFNPEDRLKYIEQPELFWCIPDNHQDTQIQMLYGIISMLENTKVVDSGNKEEQQEKIKENTDARGSDTISEES
jgi:hypothetical protein